MPTNRDSFFARVETPRADRPVVFDRVSSYPFIMRRTSRRSRAAPSAGATFGGDLDAAYQAVASVTPGLPTADTLNRLSVTGHTAADCQKFIDNYTAWLVNLDHDFDQVKDAWAKVNPAGEDAFWRDLEALHLRFKTAKADFNSFLSPSTNEAKYQALTAAIQQNPPARSTGDYADLMERIDDVEQKVLGGPPFPANPSGHVDVQPTPDDENLADSMNREASDALTAARKAFPGLPVLNPKVEFIIPWWIKLTVAAVGVSVLANELGVKHVVQRVTR